jgi:hypothetical protein
MINERHGANGERIVRPAGIARGLTGAAPDAKPIRGGDHARLAGERQSVRRNEDGVLNPSLR